MRYVFLKTVMMCVLVAGALFLTGCGLQVRSVTLVEDIEVPALSTIGAGADPGWIAYLSGQDYELNESFCDLNAFKEELAERLPAFLADRVVIQSVRVVSLDFVASQGNFSTVNELDTVLTVNNAKYVFSSGKNPNGLGDGVSLNPDKDLNLAETINDPNAPCVNAYMRIKGALPADPLLFDVVLNYRVRVALRLF